MQGVAAGLAYVYMCVLRKGSHVFGELSGIHELWTGRAVVYSGGVPGYMSCAREGQSCIRGAFQDTCAVLGKGSHVFGERSGIHELCSGRAVMYSGSVPGYMSCGQEGQSCIRGAFRDT